MMGCPRCQSLMVLETFVDFESDSHPGSFLGWRCVGCGAILDPLILLHQADRPEPGECRARHRKRGMFVSSFSKSNCDL